MSVRERFGISGRRAVGEDRLQSLLGASVDTAPSHLNDLGATESRALREARVGIATGIYERAQRMKWRRSFLPGLTLDDELELGDLRGVMTVVPPSVPAPHENSSLTGRPGAPNGFDLSEMFLPCAGPNCPHEACLWSPEEQRAYCVSCWPTLPFHLDTGLSIAPEVPPAPIPHFK